MISIENSVMLFLNSNYFRVQNHLKSSFNTLWTDK